MDKAVAALIKMFPIEDATREHITGDLKKARICFAAATWSAAKGSSSNPPSMPSKTTTHASCGRRFSGRCSWRSFDTEEEALAMAKDNDYGLATGAFTNDVSRAIRFMLAWTGGGVGQCPRSGRISPAIRRLEEPGLRQGHGTRTAGLLAEGKDCLDRAVTKPYSLTTGTASNLPRFSPPSGCEKLKKPLADSRSILPSST